jgi:hypothetical protein
LLARGRYEVVVVYEEPQRRMRRRQQLVPNRSITKREKEIEKVVGHYVQGIKRVSWPFLK